MDVVKERNGMVGVTAEEAGGQGEMEADDPEWREQPEEQQQQQQQEEEEEELTLLAHQQNYCLYFKHFSSHEDELSYTQSLTYLR